MKLLLTALLLVQVPVWAQSGAVTAPQQMGTATVSGRVTPAPGPAAASLRALRVAIVPSGYPPHTLETTVEADGSFRFANVPKGPYIARVLPGLLASVASDSPYPARAVFVADGDVSNLELEGPIAVVGRLVIEGGGQLPAADLYVRPQPGAPARGRIDIQRVVVTPTGTARFSVRNSEPLRTDGSFLVLVPPGEYQLTLAALPPRFGVRSMTSGTTDLRTNPLVVAGNVTPDIVVTLTDSRGYSVRGRVIGAPGPIPQGVAVLTQGASTPVNSDGTFELPGMPAGTYQFNLSRQGASILSGQTGSSRLAATSVTVTNQDVGNVELPWTPLIPITGRIIQIDANGAVIPGAPQAAGSPAAVTLTSVGGAPIAGGCDTPQCRRDVLSIPIQPDGTLGTSAYPMLVPPGMSTVNVERLPPGALVRSIRFGAVDLTKVPLAVERDTSPIDLEVVLQYSGVMMSGRIVTSSSAPLLPPRVTLRGTGVTARADVAGDGTFAFRAIPPGTYTVLTNPDGTAAPAGSMTVNIAVATRDVDGVPLMGLSTEYVPSTLQAANEAAAFLNVTAVQRAEQAYRSSAGRYGTLPALVAAGLLSPGHAGANAGYRLTVDASDTDFTVRALPLDTGSGRYEFYYFSASGARSLRTAAAPPANGPRTLTVTPSPVGRAALADGVLMEPVNGCGADAPLCLRAGQTGATTLAFASGRVTVTASPGASSLSLSTLYVGLLSPKGAGTLAAVQSDGSFRLDMTPEPGEYVVTVQNLPAGFRVRSVTAGGADLVNGVITLANGRLPLPINVTIESR